ncbi:MAG: ADP-ribosylation factor-like protein [Planctomycetota bacterium]
MVQINFAQKQVNAKIVYYGPGMSGKTTNLEVVHQRAPSPNRGDLTSISTDGDRTLFFDFMPLDLGTVAGMRTCFQIYTVPGQVYYNSTRKLVLQGVDGVVFVADSSAAMVQENLESLKNLEQNLNEYGKSLASLPHIIQFNKRDLPDALPVEEMQKLLNAHNAPCIEAVANTGQGVFPTLKALAARVLETIHTGARGAPAAGGMPAAPAAPATHPTGQTGFHPRPAHTAAPAGRTAGAPISMQPAAGMQPRPAMPNSVQPQRAAIPVAADATGRTGFHPPGQTAPSAPIGMAPMQVSPGHAPAGPKIQHGHGIPQGQPSHGANPGGAAQPSSIQMMRPQEPKAPAAPLASTGFNRPLPTAAARPAARPPTPRPPAQRVAPGSKPAAAAGKKKVSTTMLVVFALVVGAVVAFAVLS